VSDRQIAGGVIAGVLRNSLTTGQLRTGLFRYLWIELKRFGASNVRNVPLSRVRGINDVHVRGPVVRHGVLVLAALSVVLECERIFAVGADLDQACRVLAHNLPTARIYWLAPSAPEPLLGPRLGGEASETSRITRLTARPPTFDVSPYRGTIDLVHIDAGDDNGDIRSHTESAFSLLSELGSIVWDNYTYSSTAYAYLNRLAPTLDRPIIHILGTRLALYSRWDIVRPSD